MGVSIKEEHSSHTEIGVAVDMLTGLPIDYEVLSNYYNVVVKHQNKEMMHGYMTICPTAKKILLDLPMQWRNNVPLTSGRDL